MSFKLRSGEVVENKNNHGFVRILVYIAGTILLGFIIFSVINTNIKIEENKAKYNELVTQTDILNEQNASIERYLNNNANMDEYIEEMAREKLDYANPDERVYYIVPSAD